MPAVDILNYCNALWNSMEVLQLPVSLVALATIGNVLLLPTSFVSWLEGKSERLWLRWHSPQLSKHMDNLRRIEMEDREKERKPLLNEKKAEGCGDDIV